MAAGLECGVWAGLASLAWIGVYSAWIHQYWWACFNVAATPFFGDEVFRMGLSRATLAGAALLGVAYSLLGLFLGYWIRPVSFWGMAIRALMLALAWHFAADRWLWQTLSPFADEYFHRRAMLPAHLAWFLLMLRYRWRYYAIAEVFGEPPRVELQTPPGEEGPPAATALEEEGPP
jgi:hypothetical protein